MSAYKIMDKVRSINGVVIRFPGERWFHIVENHDDLAGRYDDILEAIECPDFILRGYKDAMLAVRRIRLNRWLVVVYKEISEEDGFIVTAYQTSKIKKEDIIWRKKAPSKNQ